MLIVHSQRGIPIRLTEERWRHIVHRHPEMEGERERVLETVADPDLIQQGDLGELLAIRRYPGRHSRASMWWWRTGRSGATAGLS